ncbi:MAG: phosphopantetheine-binding protein [Anaerovoracaceae bacterium]|jgi:acyl carrier protein
MENFENLEAEVLTMIIDKLGLDDVDPSKVDYDAPIFASYAEEDEGLGLDSVDALELVVGLKEKFDVKVSDEDMAIFRSVSSIADYVRETKGIQ